MKKCSWKRERKLLVWHFRIYDVNCCDSSQHQEAKSVQAVNNTSIRFTDGEAASKYPLLGGTIRTFNPINIYPTHIYGLGNFHPEVPLLLFETPQTLCLRRLFPHRQDSFCDYTVCCR